MGWGWGGGAGWLGCCTRWLGGLCNLARWWGSGARQALRSLRNSAASLNKLFIGTFDGRVLVCLLPFFFPFFFLGGGGGHPPPRLAPPPSSSAMIIAWHVRQGVGKGWGGGGGRGGVSSGCLDMSGIRGRIKIEVHPTDDVALFLPPRSVDGED